MKLNVVKLGFAYWNKPVLNDVGFEAAGGDFVAVVGPNGSGKSTLLKCIDGILKPKTGSIFIDGKNINSLSSLRLAQIIAYVPQSEGGGFPATVFETVLMGRKPRASWTPSEFDLKKTAAIIKQLGLGDLAFRDLDRLSGGQRQKAIIGRALAQETPLLLLDEPTSNLDIKHQLEVLELLKEQTRQGTAVVVAIHDLNLAARYADKIIMLHQGTVFAAGGPEVLSQANIESVYGVKVKIIRENGRLLIASAEAAGEKVG
ncbi:MAG: ABC transporter ATP-binding protein [Firmicutes bacterium]|nr:ABC transporter ATP-binding protein [Bacillota bacterium]